VARRHPRRRAELIDKELLAPWQAEEFGDKLLTVLASVR
jgi:hypothetical protein